MDDGVLPVREGSLVLWIPRVRDDVREARNRGIVYGIDLKCKEVSLFWDDMVMSVSSSSSVRRAVKDGIWIVEVY